MTSRNDFHIFLASNTNPTTFPTNTASNFTTLFSNSVDVSGEWEVGVKGVTVPNDIYTTDGSEKVHVCKNLVPKCERTFPSKDVEYYDLTPYNLNIDKFTLFNSAQLVTAFNATSIARKGVVRLTFSEEKRKFLLDVYCDEVVIGIGGSMRRFMSLGAPYQTTFNKGSYWSYRVIDKKADKCMANELNQIWVFPLFRLTYNEYEVCPADEDMSLKQMMVNINWYLRPRTSINFHYYTTKDPNRNKVEIDRKPSTVTSPDYNLVAINDAGQDMFNMNPLYFDETSLLHERNEYKAYGSYAKSKFYQRKPIIVRFYGRKIKDFVPCIPSTPTEYQFPRKVYKTAKELLTYLRGLQSAKYDFQFDYDEKKNRFSLKVGSDTCVRLSEVISYILGLKVEEFYYNNTYEAVWAPALDRAIDNLFIYNNLTEPVYVGNVKSPLLCITPREIKRPGGSNTHSFDSPIYMPLTRKTFNQVDITIRDGAGCIVPFMEGKTIITLHFRMRD